MVPECGYVPNVTGRKRYDKFAIDQSERFAVAKGIMNI